MDRSDAWVLSEIMRRVEARLGLNAYDEVFADTGPNNPLRRLSQRDRASLIGLLCIFLFFRDDEKFFEPDEQIARLAVNAKTFSVRLDQQMRDHRGCRIPEGLLDTYHELQSALAEFSNQFSRLNLAGKQGHIQKIRSNAYLAIGSEFVRLKTGTYNDEHLAELFQAMDSDSDNRDFSGDAIRKKRDYLQREYPQMYQVALEYATDMCNLHEPD